MTKDNQELVKYIEHKIYPYKINEKAKSNLYTLLKNYSLEFLKECVEISFSKYIFYDASGKIEENSVNNFFCKIGGIAHNSSLNPVDKEISHILNLGNKIYTYWDYREASVILKRYVLELRNNKWSDDKILNDLKTEVLSLFQIRKNWSQWKCNMHGWIDDIISWQNDVNPNIIISNSSILPNELIKDTQRNIKQLCFQINSSYENNLFDCCAVIMRRLLEILLIETFVKNNLDCKIKNESGYYLSLDKIIDKVDSFSGINFTVTTKKDLKLIKDIGNLSAHKIWYNCTKTDIDNIKQKYRIVIEELLYSSGFISN